MTPLTTPAAATISRRSARLRWVTLLFICLAPILFVSLTQDIGAHAYDAATEHIYRGVAFSAVIDDGVLFPRWSQALHWGLGSPLFTFQPPLPYYGMDLLYRLGLPHALGWRWLMALGYALAFAGMYLLARILGARRPVALVAAIAYVYAPYVLRNGLERGSNEAYSMFLYPLVLWSLIWLAQRPRAGRFILATVIWAACIASHVLGPLMLAPVAAILALVLWRGEHTVAPLLALLVGVLLTAFIWVPMGGPWGSEQAWVHIERDFNKPEAMPAQNPLQLDDLLAAPVLYDVARDNNKTGDRVGLIQTLVLLAAVPVTIYLWNRNRKLALMLGAAALLGLFLFFLFTPWSDWLWRLGGSAAAKLLYRTRLMGLQSLAAAATAALLLMALPKPGVAFAAPVLAVVLLGAGLPALYVQYQHAFADFKAAPGLAGVRAMEIRHGGTALTAFGEFTPKWRTAAFDDKLLAELGSDFDPRTRPLANSAMEVEVQSAQVRNGEWNLSLNASAPVTATLNLLYYPRWQATVDGQPRPLSAAPETGLAQFAMPQGEHTVALRYARTAAETGGLIVSGIALVVLVAVAFVGGLRGRSRPRLDAEQVHTAEVHAVGANRGGPVTGPGALFAPPVWLLVACVGLLVLKVAVIDPHTALFRCVSTAAHVCGADTTVKGPIVGAPTLRGYSAGSFHAEAGGKVPVTLYWQPEQRPDHALGSFVHIRTSAEGQQPNPAASNGMWAQEEHRSWDGLLSSELIPGKLVEDTYLLALPEDMPPGEYFLEVGWFDTATGEQADVLPESIQPPLRVLWRSILLPNMTVTAGKHRS